MIEFDNHMEELIDSATGVVAMGGYNTYCEILSFDKPALIVPRVKPREEQLLRAQRASELGLVDMLLPEQSVDPTIMAEALKRLPSASHRRRAAAICVSKGWTISRRPSAGGSTAAAATFPSSARNRAKPCRHAARSSSC